MLSGVTSLSHRQEVPPGTKLDQLWAHLTFPFYRGFKSYVAFVQCLKEVVMYILSTFTVFY